MEGRTFRDLIAWRKSVELVVSNYRVTQTWRRDELFSLTSQIRRSVASLPADLAEGQGRSGTREFLHHLSIAHGSLTELEPHLVVAHRLDVVPEPDLVTLVTQFEEVRRLVRGLIRSLHTSVQRKPPDP